MKYLQSNCSTHKCRRCGSRNRKSPYLDERYHERNNLLVRFDDFHSCCVRSKDDIRKQIKPLTDLLLTEFPNMFISLVRTVDLVW